MNKYRLVRICYDNDMNPVRFESEWMTFERATPILKTLIDNGDNAKVESYQGGAR